MTDLLSSLEEWKRTGTLPGTSSELDRSRDRDRDRDDDIGRDRDRDRDRDGGGSRNRRGRSTSAGPSGGTYATQTQKEVGEAVSAFQVSYST